MGRFQHVTGTDALQNFRVIANWTSEPNTRLLCENGGFNIFLPSDPLERDQVQIVDVNGQFQASNVVVKAPGKKICNLLEDLTLDMPNCTVTLEYHAIYEWQMIR